MADVPKGFEKVCYPSAPIGKVWGFPVFHVYDGCIVQPKVKDPVDDKRVKTTTPSKGTEARPYPPCAKDRDKPDAPAATWLTFEGTWHDPDGLNGPYKGYWTDIKGKCLDDETQKANNENESSTRDKPVIISGGLTEKQIAETLNIAVGQQDDYQDAVEWMS
jgi:hypothetical protein